MSNKVSNCLTANRERVLSSLKSRYNILPHTFILDTLMEHRASSVAKTGGEPFVIAGWRVDPVSLGLNIGRGV